MNLSINKYFVSVIPNVSLKLPQMKQQEHKSSPYVERSLQHRAVSGTTLKSAEKMVDAHEKMQKTGKTQCGTSQMNL